MQNATLFVGRPESLSIANVATTPAKCLHISQSAGIGAYDVYAVRATRFSGKCRVDFHVNDGSLATVHYFITPQPFVAQVGSVGDHWADVAWLPYEYPDPFGRSASVMPWYACRYCNSRRDFSGKGTSESVDFVFRVLTWSWKNSNEWCDGIFNKCRDREDGVHVLDDSRAYDVGLSDDAGAGNNLGFGTNVRGDNSFHVEDLECSGNNLIFSLFISWVNAHKRYVCRVLGELHANAASCCTGPYEQLSAITRYECCHWKPPSHQLTESWVCLRFIT